MDKPVKYISDVNYVGPHQILTTSKSSYTISSTIDGKTFLKTVIEDYENKDNKDR